MTGPAKTDPSDIPFGPADTPWQKAFSGLRTLDGMPTVTPPSSDPREIYDDVPGIAYAGFQLPACGLTVEQYTAAESLLRAHLQRQCRNSVGFQLNGDLDYQHRLAPYLDLPVNNAGDPYRTGSVTHNTKILERAVLDYFASLWNARWPHRDDDPESYWGYTLTMGASEGNLYALWNAREYLSGNPLLHPTPGPPVPGTARNTPAAAHREQDSDAFHPVVLFSEDTHYSVTKATRLLGLDTMRSLGERRFPGENPLGPGIPWPAAVPSAGGGEGDPGGDGDGDGTVDVDRLAVIVRFFASRGFPVIVNLNYGSAFKGAYDDVAAAARVVHDICAEYGLDERHVDHGDHGDHGGHGGPDRPGGSGPTDVRTGYWLHVDGALGAGYAPYLRMAHQAGLVAAAPPLFDFRLPQVHSITTSGHKWLGAPWPCGVYLTRTRLRMLPPADSEYIGSADTTFGGSRNGFSPLVMWDQLARRSYDDQIRAAVECDRLAGYAHDRLRDLQAESGRDLWVARSPCSLAVRFRRPSASIVTRYSLSCETTRVAGLARPYAHLYAMRHVTRDLIDALIRDLAAPGAFPPESTTA
ncbi:pyridoxal-dependent decarboxylase [Parafrankia discariae]|uniref:pyridoxal-dependent decarboxylase n=1 Tax=Parafrankia discariae TaxID=365528 RepID=UPI000377EF28|nr:pyridoxal-dependent decarboxylase [Parafrankia discariae]